MSNSMKSDALMEDMWRDAAARFSERTGKNVNLKPPKTLDECIKKLKQSRVEQDSHEPTGKEKAEEYGIRTIHLLRLLGGAATKVAEIVSCSPGLYRHFKVITNNSPS